MKYILLPTLFFLLISCSTPITNDLSNEDQEAISQMITDYVDGWLAGDSSKVMSLFHEDAIILPSGMDPIEGNDNMAAFWFPDDGSMTEIHSYTIRVVELDGNKDWAYTREEGDLSFSYSNDDFSMSRKSHSSAITIFGRDDQGKWKISRRLWSDRRQ